MNIKSKCGKYDILIDKEDFELINIFAVNGWEAKFTTGSNNPYAVTRKTVDKKRKHYLMHRVIMDVLNTPSKFIDHINRNPLDNRKENLRIVTARENMKNRSTNKNSACKYLGISHCKSKRGSKKYRVNIQDLEIKRGNIHLGYYYNEETAGFAYNIAAKIVHKEYANLNNINENLINDKDEIIEYVTNQINVAIKKYKL